MERPKATTFRRAVDRLTGGLRLRWRETLLATSVAIVAAATAGLAGLQVSSRPAQTADALGLPDVMKSRCLNRPEEQP